MDKALTPTHSDKRESQQDSEAVRLNDMKRSELDSLQLNHAANIKNDKLERELQQPKRDDKRKPNSYYGQPSKSPPSNARYWQFPHPILEGTFPPPAPYSPPPNTPPFQSYFPSPQQQFAQPPIDYITSQDALAAGFDPHRPRSAHVIDYSPEYEDPEEGGVVIRRRRPPGPLNLGGLAMPPVTEDQVKFAKPRALLRRHMSGDRGGKVVGDVRAAVAGPSREGERKKDESGAIQASVEAEAEVEVDEDGNVIDPQEQRYCVCNRVSAGTMVLCENVDCPYEWFHLECLDLKTEKDLPKLWYCPECRISLGMDGAWNQHLISSTVAYYEDDLSDSEFERKFGFSREVLREVERKKAYGKIALEPVGRRHGGYATLEQCKAAQFLDELAEKLIPPPLFAENELTQSTAEVRAQQVEAPIQEGTVADSGYVSACTPRSIAAPNSYGDSRTNSTPKKPVAPNGLPAPGDQKTEYTSSVLLHGSDYISDLCNDIYLKLKHDLQNHVHDRVQIELPRCLPDLIKAFSIRIGLDTSEPARAYIMHFLHTHYRDIVAGLEDLCQSREESLELGHRNTDEEEMTVLDRMALWNRKENEKVPQEPNQDGLFEGVRDIKEEDIAGNARITTYREFVLSSTSYQWFIESMKKQLSQDWGPDDLTDASSCRPIYHSILSRIPRGIISRHRIPEIHRARFGIQMHPDVFHYLAKGSITDLMTLTSSAPNIVQALPVKHYLDQTWSSEGLRLAQIIQKAFDGEQGVVHTDEFDGSTWITAQLIRLDHSDLPKLLVTVSGSRYSISECGEQLAWLCAAFQKPIGKLRISSCTCSIESQRESEWSINYYMDSSMVSSTTKTAQVAHSFCDATIIRGFPTQKRPSLFQGLELGLVCMLECIGASWPPVFDNGRTLFESFYHIPVMELAKHTQDVWLWHVIHPGSTSCSFPECPFRNEHGMPYFESPLQPEFVSLELARKDRHIVANMEYLGFPVVSTGPAKDKEMGHAFARTEIPSVEIPEYIDPVLSPGECRSSARGSSGDSLDSDMLSLSTEDSDCVKSLDPEGNLALMINHISERIFAEYKESMGFRSIAQWAPTENCEREGNSDTPGNSGSSSNQSTSCEASQLDRVEARRSGKRSRPNDEEGDGDWDDGGFRRPPRPAKRPARSPNRPHGKILACPFWKLDCQAHSSCFRMRCSRIADVKYHLSRKHRQPASEYCQRCWIAFENDSHKVAHLSDESGRRCKYNPDARPVGIDNTMAAALHKKSNPKHSTEDQWFAIWEIVFPGQPRPSSPYIDDSLAEEAIQLQEHIVNRWPSILATELNEAWASAGSNEAESLGLEHLIRVTLSRLSDDFSTERAQIRGARAATDHQSPGSWGNTPSSSVHADSAIELDAGTSNLYSSAGSSIETSRSFHGPVGPQIETHSPAGSQSSTIQSRRARFILPQDQNSSGVNYDHQHQIPMPSSMTRPGVIPSDLPSVQTPDAYRAGPAFEIGLDHLIPRLTEGYASPKFFASGELDANGLLESDLSEFDWEVFDS